MTSSMRPPPPPPPPPPPASGPAAPLPPPGPGPAPVVPPATVSVPEAVPPASQPPIPYFAPASPSPSIPVVYRPVADLGRWTMRLMVALAIVAAIGSILELIQFGLLGRVLLVAPEKVAGNDSRMAVYGWTELALGAAALGAFLAWFARVSSNLRTDGRGSPAAHRPVEVLARTWGTDDGDRETPWWLRPWAWSVVGAAGLITVGRAISLVAAEVAQLQLASALFALGDLALVVAALGGFAVVRSVSENQEAARWAALSSEQVAPAFVN